MLRTLPASLAVLLASLPAAARPGLYFGGGLGSTAIAGEEVAQERLQADPGTMPPQGLGYIPTTEIDGGLGALLKLGYNIRGYAAIETNVSGLGHNLSTSSKRSWAALWHTGVRVYPAWHWQEQFPAALREVEPSLFLGWGMTYLGYAPAETAVLNEEVAWEKWGSWQFGVGAEYFSGDYVKLGIDYHYTRASFDKFIFDANDGQTYAVDPQATTGFHQLFLTVSFHFDLSRYARPPVAPTPTAPVAPPVEEPSPEPEAAASDEIDT